MSEAAEYVNKKIQTRTGWTTKSSERRTFLRMTKTRIVVNFAFFGRERLRRGAGVKFAV
ncbi:MAG: hypothetical protein L6V93_10335 [Clostridiales bacterium]|nr:MAG: hypothetical protein L6V93_10335 [Clostridiales bacterium]